MLVEERLEIHGSQPVLVSECSYLIEVASDGFLLLYYLIDPVLNEAIKSRHSFIINGIVFVIIGIAIKKERQVFMPLSTDVYIAYFNLQIFLGRVLSVQVTSRLSFMGITLNMNIFTVTVLSS